MGCGASVAAEKSGTSADDKPKKATKKATMASADHLNILLQEDLTIRGGAQLWLMNCGSRLQEAGHNVTFLLPSNPDPNPHPNP